MPVFVKALLAVMFGIPAGGVFNYMLGEQGADTTALAICGTVLPFAIFIVLVRRRSR